ncbi:MAG: cold shock domain-containing protein [Proteobacteria bacterium]|nr:cold shock domain-containing protein [Patescibacteria group bacterium]MBU4287372.1 cold shock domain-containing protein [Pseudomonadota bacterium]
MTIICNTALADNLRRWSKALSSDKQIENAAKKLLKSYDIIVKAFDLNKDDNRTRNTFLEISNDLAAHTLRYQGLEKATPYFLQAITENPKTGAENRINTMACLHFAKALLQNNQSEEAKKYCLLGKKTVLPDSSYVKSYNNLEMELIGPRCEGRLVRVNEDKAYGFIEKGSETVFVHITDLMQKISNAEFKELEGSIVDFVEIHSEKGLNAKSVRIL